MSDSLTPRMVATVLFYARKVGLIASWSPLQVRSLGVRLPLNLYKIVQTGHSLDIQFTKGGAVREIARLLERDVTRPGFPVHSKAHLKLLDALSACASAMENDR